MHGVVEQLAEGLADERVLAAALGLDSLDPPVPGDMQVGRSHRRGQTLGVKVSRQPFAPGAISGSSACRICASPKREAVGTTFGCRP